MVVTVGCNLLISSEVLVSSCLSHCSIVSVNKLQIKVLQLIISFILH